MKRYNDVLGSVEGLRRGITTGTCAAAAAKAAALQAVDDFVGGVHRDSSVMEWSETDVNVSAATAAAENKNRKKATGPVSNEEKCVENRQNEVIITLPASRREYGGREIAVPVEAVRREGEWYIATVRKDAGDDDDITHNTLIGARVKIVGPPAGSTSPAGPGSKSGSASVADTASKTDAVAEPASGESRGTMEAPRAEAPITESPIEEELITITGGEGVGTVTKRGLKVPVGEKAINPTPRAMIRSELKALLFRINRVGKQPGQQVRQQDVPLLMGRGFTVQIFVPEGERLAERTWNPRLGIEGGISIIGTGGVVEPRSSKAFMATIATFIKAVSEQGVREIVVTPGYVGERFLFTALHVPERQVVTVGDHVGFGFRQCTYHGFRKITFAGHIGKAAKLAAGLFNTHSKYGDARLETIAACAAAAGADQGVVNEILDLRLAEEAVPLLRQAGLNTVFAIIAERVVRRLQEHVWKNRAAITDRRPEIYCVLLDLDARPLTTVPHFLRYYS